MAGFLLLRGFLIRAPPGWKVAFDTDSSEPYYMIRINTSPSLKLPDSTTTPQSVPLSCASEDLAAPEEAQASQAPLLKRQRILHDKAPSRAELGPSFSCQDQADSEAEEGTTPSPLDSLPDDVLLTILSQSAQGTQSPADFINMLMTSRRLCHLGGQAQVLARLPFRGLHMSASGWSPASYGFLLRCSQAGNPGNPQAQYALGMIAFYCLNMPAWGLRLLAQSAIARCPEALYSLGVIHFNGSSGGKEHRDVGAGVHLCIQAAALGHADAMRELGHCFQDGYGLRQDAAQGRLLLTKANALENAVAARLASVGSVKGGSWQSTPRGCGAHPICALDVAISPRRRTEDEGQQEDDPTDVLAVERALVRGHAPQNAGRNLRRSFSEPVYTTDSQWQPWQQGNLTAADAAAASDFEHPHDEHSDQCCCIPPATLPLAAQPEGWIRKFLFDWNNATDGQWPFDTQNLISPSGWTTTSVESELELQEEPEERQQQRRRLLCSNATCGRVELRGNEFRCCSACAEVRYCSRVCQAKDWKAGHKALCAHLAESRTVRAATNAAVDRPN